MGIFDGIIKFEIKKNLEKWAKGGATAIVAAGVPILAKNAGINLTQEQQAAATVAIGSAIVGISNALKTQFPAQLGWL